MYQAQQSTYQGCGCSNDSYSAKIVFNRKKMACCKSFMSGSRCTDCPNM